MQKTCSNLANEDGKLDAFAGFLRVSWWHLRKHFSIRSHEVHVLPDSWFTTSKHLDADEMGKIHFDASCWFKGWVATVGFLRQSMLHRACWWHFWLPWWFRMPRAVDTLWISRNSNLIWLCDGHHCMIFKHADKHRLYSKFSCHWSQASHSVLWVHYFLNKVFWFSVFLQRHFGMSCSPSQVFFPCFWSFDKWQKSICIGQHRGTLYYCSISSILRRNRLFGKPPDIAAGSCVLTYLGDTKIWGSFTRLAPFQA